MPIVITRTDHMIAEAVTRHVSAVWAVVQPVVKNVPVGTN